MEVRRPSGERTGLLSSAGTGAVVTVRSTMRTDPWAHFTWKQTQAPGLADGRRGGRHPSGRALRRYGSESEGGLDPRLRRGLAAEDGGQGGLGRGPGGVGDAADLLASEVDD